MDEDEWELDLTGRIHDICLDGVKQNVEIVEMLTEDEDESMAIMRVRAIGRIQETGAKLLMSMRYDLKPDDYDIEDVEAHHALVRRYCAFEMDIIDLLFDIGHGPRLIGGYRYHQADTSPCPGGFMYLDVMEVAPGDDVEDIMDDLTDDELLSIRKQLAYILNELAKINVTMGGQHPSFLQYDRENDKLYLVDISHWSDHDIGEEIGMNSAYVIGFGLWNDLVPDEEEYPWKVEKEVEKLKEELKKELEEELEEEIETQKYIDDEEKLIEEGDREIPRPPGSLPLYPSGPSEKQLKPPSSRGSPERLPEVSYSVENQPLRPPGSRGLPERFPQVSYSVENQPPRPPGSRGSPQRPGSQGSHFVVNPPTSLVPHVSSQHPGSPTATYIANPPMSSRSRESPRHAVLQEPRESTSTTVDVLSDLLETVTMDEPGQEGETGEAATQGGNSGNGARAGRNRRGRRGGRRGRRARRGNGGRGGRG